MDVFMCDCCKEIEPDFRRCKITLATHRHPEPVPKDVCIGCFDRIDGFIRSLTVPFPEPPESP